MIGIPERLSGLLTCLTWHFVQLSILDFAAVQKLNELVSTARHILMRALMSESVVREFSGALANGITRFGLQLELLRYSS